MKSLLIVLLPPIAACVKLTKLGKRDAIREANNVTVVKIRIAAPRRSLTYRYQAYQPSIKEQIVVMAINGSGARDTGRVLKISKDTVINTLKKSGQSSPSQP